MRYILILLSITFLIWLFNKKPIEVPIEPPVVDFGAIEAEPQTPVTGIGDLMVF